MSGYHYRPHPILDRALPDCNSLWRHHEDERVLQLEAIERIFESARAQFDAASFAEAEWQHAADLLDDIYDACAAQRDINMICALCDEVDRAITVAVERSGLQSARIDAASAV